MIVEVVILAMIAAFLGLRLYSVLGRRPEQNEEPMRGRIEQTDPARTARPATPKIAENATLTPRPREGVDVERPGLIPGAENGVRAIVAADRRFDVGLFLVGARGAYGMVLDAFWRGDKDELAQLCDRDVYEGFVGVIDAREAAGETIENKLIRIEEATIVAAEFAAPVARISVHFRADIAALTRDKDGNVIAGSLHDAVESNDVWTFSRDLTSRDPDWLLDETDEG